MFAFEESPDQIIRNMKSIGIDLKQWIDGGLLHIRAARPTLHGLEMHLLEMHRLVQKHRPSAVIIDPISNLMDVGDEPEVESILVRLIDYLKSEGVTCYCTSLSVVGELESTTRTGISSVMDTWILLKIIESNGERNRGLYVLKARGIANSNQIREMKITRHGVKLVDAYVGRAGVLTGTARYIQEGKDRLESLGREQEQLQRRRGLERKRRILEARIAALEAEFEVDESEVNELLEQDEARDKMYERSDSVVAKLRQADSD
jgi:circadian clock protein KaiC